MSQPDRGEGSFDRHPDPVCGSLEPTQCEGSLFWYVDPSDVPNYLWCSGALVLSQGRTSPLLGANRKDRDDGVSSKVPKGNRDSKGAGPEVVEGRKFTLTRGGRPHYNDGLTNPSR